VVCSSLLVAKILTLSSCVSLSRLLKGAFATREDQSTWPAFLAQLTGRTPVRAHTFLYRYLRSPLLVQKVQAAQGEVPAYRESELVTRFIRAHMNDVEVRDPSHNYFCSLAPTSLLCGGFQNVLPFLAVGFLYALSGLPHATAYVPAFFMRICVNSRLVGAQPFLRVHYRAIRLFLCLCTISHNPCASMFCAQIRGLCARRLWCKSNRTATSLTLLQCSGKPSVRPAFLICCVDSPLVWLVVSSTMSMCVRLLAAALAA
jgi:hypothetical protein